MGDPNLNPNPFSLPPGTRFYPSDSQLISFYLSSKNQPEPEPEPDHTNLIKELDLYNYDPFNLPDSSCFKYGRGGCKRHWFCFLEISRVLKCGGRRKAGGGYWKKRGRVRDVVGEGTGKVVIGTRKSFAFYLGDSVKSATKTDWVLYEYALIGRPMASFVLCRVFIKSRQGNSLSEQHVLSSYGEETVGAVRHVGIQYDGPASVSEYKMHDENSIDQENDVSKLPNVLVTDLNDQTLTKQQIDLESEGPPVLNDFSAQELMAILEGGFIELDDLLCPLPGIS